MADKIRVFVSYSSDEFELAARLVTAIEARGLFPLWSKNIQPSDHFNNEIKELIKRAHIFAPLLTKKSMKRPWVHQETGYAMAVNIPIIPITVGVLPDQMIAPIEAIRLETDFSDLDEQLANTDFDRIVSGSLLHRTATIEVAEWPDRRTELIAESAKRVLHFGEHGMLRQRGTLSSFSLPDRNPNDPIWDAREGTKRRPHSYRERQRNERSTLEEHVRVAGCRVIFHPRTVKRRDPAAMPPRLGLIIEFLESVLKEPQVKDRPIEFLWSPQEINHNLIVVGNWFSAESRVPRDGYEQTLFEWHAPRVRRALQEFDDEFEGADAEHRYSNDPKSGENTLEDLIDRLTTLMEEWAKE